MAFPFYVYNIAYMAAGFKQYFSILVHEMAHCVGKDIRYQNKAES